MSNMWPIEVYQTQVALIAGKRADVEEGSGAHEHLEVST